MRLVDRHGEVDLVLVSSRDRVVEADEAPLEPQVVTVKRPEHERGHQRDDQQAVLAVDRGEAGECRRNGDGPALEEKRVGGHPADYCLDELEVLELGFHDQWRSRTYLTFAPAS